MVILILGLVLFLGIHSIKIAAPDWRGRLIVASEGPYKGLYSLISAVGLVLIVWGFVLAAGGGALVYVRPAWGADAAAILMAPALVLAIASSLPTGNIARVVRHPLLVATILWAAAHLLANGDLAGTVLFGAFLLWAIADLVVQPAKAVPASLSARSDIIAVVVGLVLYALLVWRLHAWLFGVSPLA